MCISLIINYLIASQEVLYVHPSTYFRACSEVLQTLTTPKIQLLNQASHSAQRFTSARQRKHLLCRHFGLVAAAHMSSAILGWVEIVPWAKHAAQKRRREVFLYEEGATSQFSRGKK